MASFRTIVALTVISGACIFAALSSAAAQPPRAVVQPAAAPAVQVNQGVTQGFARCPKSADQFVAVMRQLTSSAARARALADQNPLLEPDAAFYEAELTATQRCAPAVAVLTH